MTPDALGRVPTGWHCNRASSRATPRLPLDRWSGPRRRTSTAPRQACALARWYRWHAGTVLGSDPRRS